MAWRPYHCGAWNDHGIEPIRCAQTHMEATHGERQDYHCLLLLLLLWVLWLGWAVSTQAWVNVSMCAVPRNSITQPEWRETRHVHISGQITFICSNEAGILTQISRHHLLYLYMPKPTPKPTNRHKQKLFPDSRHHGSWCTQIKQPSNFRSIFVNGFFLSPFFNFDWAFEVSSIIMKFYFSFSISISFPTGKIDFPIRKCSSFPGIRLGSV